MNTLSFLIVAALVACGVNAFTTLNVHTGVRTMPFGAALKMSETDLGMDIDSMMGVDVTVSENLEKLHKTLEKELVSEFEAIQATFDSALEKEFESSYADVEKYQAQIEASKKISS
mmetsp:Transcript_5616/g.8495  ORF Transcript_5616/g.8495 Transcript_5616/m.8495 type:complete len:116 (-) Transcript_5616:247-594(-)|eukprot:CAMPEP_0113936672 /NCGR_PEP_ID=MMETSP1339-20121228/3510_1 /TAXON_ID=94617 /ORGANISM="Fibrocapsa japonica" /LENGTH=115 /DNA_ID=CAMNT_0000939205 /DNA_START=113 /DNA_END=460 /DNA_ORIENTATION=- /assembly_acc=CAM_ASM_000762